MFHAWVTGKWFWDIAWFWVWGLCVEFVRWMVSQSQALQYQNTTRNTNKYTCPNRDSQGSHDRFSDLFDMQVVCRTLYLHALQIILKQCKINCWVLSSESSGMYCRVFNWMSTDVSEVRAASITRALRWNVCRHSIKNTAVHPRRFRASYSPLWELEISHVKS
jgi:hypothetical protein